MNNNYVALYNDGKYVVGIINEEKCFFKKDIRKLLPVVLKSDICTSKFLDNISNVGYFELDHEFRVFDKTNKSYFEISVPVYVRKYGNLKITNKKYNIKIPTENMINDAITISHKIAIEIEIVKHKDDIEKINSLFLDGSALIYTADDDFTDIDKAIQYTNKNILWQNGANYIIGCPDNISDTSSNLELSVPLELKGYIIGKKGANIRYMEEIMKKGITIKTF